MTHKISFITHAILPLGAILPWVIAVVLVQLMALKNNDTNSVNVMTSAIHLMIGGTLVFLASLVATFFIRPETSSMARFGWGAGISVIILLLGWFLSSHNQRKASQHAAQLKEERESRRAALLAKKDPTAPSGSTRSFLGEMIMIRPLDGIWKFRAPHTQVEGESASTMGVYYARIEDFQPNHENPRTLIGWIDDPGSGVDGFWVTAVKQSSKNVNLIKTQRYSVWIDSQKPTGYESDGTPIHQSGLPKNTLWGTADVISQIAYDGYDPKDVEL